ncbi:MAG TPA: hypothetical protein VLS93_17800 [Anaeromyxobacteraceae bacterium]|nr:hypothetical protein [Anaeromyxobacteraceae bacterium]
MRAALAAALALLVLLGAAAPHVHAGPRGDHDCLACTARGAEEARAQAPDLRPAARPEGPAPRRPGLAPVTGAPLGAVPGQSPPASS